MKAQSGKYGGQKAQEEKMAGNGREWLIDMGQGPVRREKRLREKWDEAQLAPDESSMVVPARTCSHVPLFSRQPLASLALLPSTLFPD